MASHNGRVKASSAAGQAATDLLAEDTREGGCNRNMVFRRPSGYGSRAMLEDSPEEACVLLDDLGSKSAIENRSGSVRAERSLFARKYVAVYPHLRKNDLLLSLGLLELANATDFAANVWNATPPPTISIVFMVLGGTTALIILSFAYRDVPRSWRNISLLRQERHSLNCLKVQLAAQSDTTSFGDLTERDILTYRDVNIRELGNEIVDRLAMGIALGFGALTVGAGTYVATAGANPRAFLASNILTGYLGNVPAALYGLANSAWCVYGYRRAQAHLRAMKNRIPQNGPWTREVDIIELLRARESRVKTHALVNGVSGILGGAGSLMTASAYIHPHAVWGYLILIPCIISAVIANVMWRHRINYDREITKPQAINAQELLEETSHAALKEQLVLQYRRDNRPRQSPWARVTGSRATIISNDGLQAFLNAYFALSSQHLKVAEEAAMQQRDKAANDATGETQKTALRQKLRKIEASFQTLEVHAARWIARPDGQPVRPKAHGLLAGLLIVLVDLQILPTLFARLANDASTAHLLDIDEQVATQTLTVNISTIEKHLHEAREELVIAVLNHAVEIMMNEGAHAASSRTRYLLEVVGCYFAGS